MLKKLLMSAMIAMSLLMCCAIPVNAAGNNVKASNGKTDGIQVAIDGKEWDFYLYKTVLQGTLVRADYYAYTPRGDIYYRLVLQFDEDINTGTYGYKTAAVTLSCDYNAGSGYFDEQYVSGYRYNFQFTIDEKSDDWTAFAGSFNGQLMKSGNTQYSCKVSCDAFSVAIQEYAEAEAFYEKTGRFNTPGSKADRGATRNAPKENTVAATELEVQDIIQVTVDGKEWDFYLYKTVLQGTLARADYYAYTPRGDIYYRLVLQFDEDINTGTYGYKTAAVTLSCDYNAGSGYFDEQYVSGYRYNFQFTIDEKSDDWTAFDGSFNGQLMKSGNTQYSRKVSCDAFSVTIQAYAEAEAFYEKTGRFNTPGRKADSGASRKADINTPAKEPVTIPSDKTDTTPATTPSNYDPYNFEFDSDWYLPDDNFEDACFSCFGSGDCDSCGGDGCQEAITFSVTGNRCRTCEGSGKCIWCNGRGR